MKHNGADGYIATSDCLPWLREQSNLAITCTVTSPPYNKGEIGAVLAPPVEYDCVSDSVDERAYQSNQIEVLNEIYRLTKPGGSCFYNHKPRWVNGVGIYPCMWLQQTKWNLRQCIIWNRKITANLRGWRYWQTHEEIWWLYKPKKETFEMNKMLASWGSVWDIPVSEANREFKHPCPFPISIPARCIMATTEIDDIVFDPYCGVGSTLLAADELGRRYVGLDISIHYVNKAIDRLDMGASPKEREILKRESERANRKPKEWK